MEHNLYYRLWCLCQKWDVAFFTYKEDIQNIIIIFTYISIFKRVLNIFNTSIKSTISSS